MSPSTLAHFQAFITGLMRDVAREAAKEALAAKQAPKFATAKHNPLGSSRKFLEAGRRKAFPVKRVGRENVALWSDVEAWMASCPTPRTKNDDDDMDTATLLAMSAGRRPRRG